MTCGDLVEFLESQLLRDIHKRSTKRGGYKKRQKKIRATPDPPSDEEWDPSVISRKSAFNMHVAVYCSVLQCVAVCCSVLQCGILVYFLESQLSIYMLQCVAVCCSVLQCIAVYCSVGS